MYVRGSEASLSMCRSAGKRVVDALAWAREIVALYG